MEEIRNIALGTFNAQPSIFIVKGTLNTRVIDSLAEFQRQNTATISEGGVNAVCVDVTSIKNANFSWNDFFLKPNRIDNSIEHMTNIFFQFKPDESGELSEIQQNVLKSLSNYLRTPLNKQKKQAVILSGHRSDCYYSNGAVRHLDKNEGNLIYSPQIVIDVKGLSPEALSHLYQYLHDVVNLPITDFSLCGTFSSTYEQGPIPGIVHDSL